MTRGLRSHCGALILPKYVLQKALFLLFSTVDM